MTTLGGASPAPDGALRSALLAAAAAKAQQDAADLAVARQQRAQAARDLLVAMGMDPETVDRLELAEQIDPAGPVIVTNGSLTMQISASSVQLVQLDAGRWTPVPGSSPATSLAALGATL